MLRILMALTVSAAAAWTPAASSISDDRPARQSLPPVFTARVDLVVLQVKVTDRNGRFVGGLGREMFTVLDEGQPQRVALFVPTEAPVTVGLLVDDSGSMQGVREQVTAAAGAFAANSLAQDELFALTFTGETRPVLPPTQPFTPDGVLLQDALRAVRRTRGRTAVYDAIIAGLAHAAQGRHPGKVLVLVSDGGDNASRQTFDEVRQAAQRADTVIYTVAIVDPLERDTGRRQLRRLADLTGGESYEPRDLEGVQRALREIARDIRQVYTVGYVPSAPADHARLRRLEVRLNDRARQGWRVRARRGYIAGD